jgi:hypothetical protein
MVGSWPCAVFGTIAADGRMHAHRIYLSSDGRAKADLGIGPDGKPRDPKKSAKLADGKVSTAGCAVIWGNPEIARHLLLIEGIENAAAVAHALIAEIEANEIYVASAINAGGVEAFVAYPATELVTVGADRDEAKEGAGYRRGEHSARTFALRNRDRVEVRIGLPGGPGESTMVRKRSDQASSVPFLSSLLHKRSRTHGRRRSRRSTSRRSQRPIHSRCWRLCAWSIGSQRPAKSGCTNSSATRGI